jgi:hypothetical protein
VAFAGQAFDIETAQHGVGAGQPLSLAIAAAVATVIFALALVRKAHAGRQASPR